MNTLIRFFLSKPNLNYTLFVFLFVLGVLSYMTIPKDIYPAIKINKIQVSGGYAGTSIDTLNNMVVTKLEKNLRSLNGVKELDTFVQTGSFSIIMTLEDNADKRNILDHAKSIISNTRVDLPNDMDEPIASLIDFSFPLVSVTLSSATQSKESLIGIAEELKDKLSSINNISQVSLYEDTSKIFEIVFDNQKIDMYGLNKQSLMVMIQNISYVYPLGMIKGEEEQFLLSTKNSEFKESDFLNTLLKIDGKNIYLSDIATVKKKYNDTDIITKFNGESNIQLAISKNDKANSIALVKHIKDEIEIINNKYQEVEINAFEDMSVAIKSRLNTVVSSILFGIILIGLSMSILINKRVAFVVVLGIPTTILIGVVFLDIAEHSINMMSLIGTLLILGVLVDDAVIIAENVQRHIQMGEEKLQATIEGTKEVMIPVFVSSLTTMFAFIPMFVLTGEIGEFLKMIPVAIVVLILASLLESFVFLPMHSYHILDAKDKELDWSRFNNFYQKILSYFIYYRKTFLVFFMLVIPFIGLVMLSEMRYQLFPDYDSNNFSIKGKFSVNTKVDETYAKTQIIEAKLLELKEEYAIKSLSYLSGVRLDNQEQLEIKPSVFQFDIELYDRVPVNFVEEFINPFLAIEHSDSQKIRIKDIDSTILELKKILEPLKSNDLEDFSIKKQGSGIVRNDIEILLSSPDTKKLMLAITKVKKELNAIDGIISVDDSAKWGTKELKLDLNEYGKELGFTQADLGVVLSSSYLEGKQGKVLGKEGIIEIKTKSLQKDNIESLKNYELVTADGSSMVLLSDICDFSYKRGFETLYKHNGMDVKIVFANVNHKTITPTEALIKLEPLFESLKEEGVIVKLEGEQEQNEQMMKELSYAFMIALFLIFITLLVMFDSYAQTLMLLSIIPFSVIGAIVGHLILDMNFTLSSVIGILGLAGVVINDGVIMLDFIRHAKSIEELTSRAKLRLRPIMITSITTFLGLSTLIFFASGQAKILQPVAVSLGFGLLWGTILTLLYLPALFAVLNRKKLKER